MALGFSFARWELVLLAKSEAAARPLGQDRPRSFPTTLLTTESVTLGAKSDLFESWDSRVQSLVMHQLGVITTNRQLTGPITSFAIHGPTHGCRSLYPVPCLTARSCSQARSPCVQWQYRHSCHKQDTLLPGDPGHWRDSPPLVCRQGHVSRAVVQVQGCFWEPCSSVHRRQQNSKSAGTTVCWLYSYSIGWNLVNACSAARYASDSKASRECQSPVSLEVWVWIPLLPPNVGQRPK